MRAPFQLLAIIYSRFCVYMPEVLKKQIDEQFIAAKPSLYKR